jgi:hypothetical protein
MRDCISWCFFCSCLVALLLFQRNASIIWCVCDDRRDGVDDWESNPLVLANSSLFIPAMPEKASPLGSQRKDESLHPPRPPHATRQGCFAELLVHVIFLITPEELKKSLERLEAWRLSTSTYPNTNS